MSENKELTPLEALEILTDSVYYGIIESDKKLSPKAKTRVLNAYHTIEKALKALEIIKEKKVDVFSLICCMKLNKYTALETYNLKKNCHNYFLTQEDFDLLKEVLL